MKNHLKITFDSGPWFKPRVTRKKADLHSPVPTKHATNRPRPPSAPSVLVILPDGKVVRRAQPRTQEFAAGSIH